MKERANGRPLAIVIGRNYTTRLTLTRAAGMVGCDVVLIQTDRRKSNSQKIDRSSKYVINYHHCPEPHQQQLIETIRQYENPARQIILVPADDYAASIIDQNYDELKTSFIMPNVKGKQGGVLMLMNKDYQKTLAKKVGFNVAKGWVATYSTNGYVLPEGVLYPCFIKPVESYNGALKNLMKKCNNKKDLLQVLSQIPKSYNHPLLIEEYINIDKEYGVQGASLENYSIIPSALIKEKSLRGITAAGRIFPISDIPGLQAKLFNFFKETCFVGIFDIDLFESGGHIYFNELNVRLGANGFALTYGVDNVPGHFIQYMLGNRKDRFDVPKEFKSLSFVSEQVLREMYYDRLISFKEYKHMRNRADIYSIKNRNDMGPYRQFSKSDWILPLWRVIRNMKH